MRTRRSAMLSVATVLALSVVLAGCDDSDDGGGGGAVRAYFGTNNIRACMPIQVDVDLDAANAVVAQANGSLDCAIDAALAGGGCVATFEELSGGDLLRVTIDGCEVPEVSSLFECGFTEGDLSALALAVSSVCDCVGEPICQFNIFCDPTPGICVSDEANAGACEDCFNAVDDDGNGFTDCEDQNCHIENCGFGQTTITCSTSTTTTTTTLAIP